MPRFFLDDINGGTATICGSDATHISKSLRMKIGEDITICDTKGSDYFCKIESIGENIACKIISSEKTKAEPSVKVTLYQAIPKLDKLELIIQKSVELGVHEIVPVLTNRCISRPDKQTMDKKLERYSKICLEAAKQSGRGIIPVVSKMITLKEAFDRMECDDLAIICYEGEGGNLSEMELEKKRSISILIGGEGGFDKEEVALAQAQNVQVISLGNRILRCETAPLAALAIIMNLTGNM